MSNELTVSQAVNRRIASKAYLPEGVVDAKDMALITDAGLWAPTANNIQNSKIIAIQDKALKNEVANLFHDGNKLQVESAQVVFLFAGKIWNDKNDAEMEEVIYDHSISKWGLPSDELARNMSKGTVDYYNNVSDFKKSLDVYSSTTQMAMMMLEASALGYDTNGMLGFEQEKLTKFLEDKKILEPGWRVNVSFSMGHRDPEHERNKLAHNRIEKDRIVKVI